MNPGHLPDGEGGKNSFHGDDVTLAGGSLRHGTGRVRDEGKVVELPKVYRRVPNAAVPHDHGYEVHQLRNGCNLVGEIGPLGDPSEANVSELWKDIRGVI